MWSRSNNNFAINSCADQNRRRQKFGVKEGWATPTARSAVYCRNARQCPHLRGAVVQQWPGPTTMEQ